MTPLSSVLEELAALSAAGLLRERRTVDRRLIDVASNDYLGFASEPLDAPLAPTAEGSGAGASPLVRGNHAVHEAATTALAETFGVGQAMLFSSGYAANVGVLSALAAEGDVIISDALNHASIIDGCRLSKARVIVTAHGDAAAVEQALASTRGARRQIVVTESYFSMDGTTPDLARLREATSRAGALLIVDEAHALGLLGPSGLGLTHGARPDVLVGTFGKSFGLQGAFVGGAPALIELLWNRARSFVFSTGLSPAIAALIPRRLGALLRADGRRAAVLGLAEACRETLAAQGAELLGSGPIVPWILGDPGRALRVQRTFEERGFHVAAIRPPTVPEGTSRVRLVCGFSAVSSKDELLATLRGFRKGAF